MADQGEFRRPSELEGGAGEIGEARRVAPGRRTLTQTIGGAAGSGAPASPGKLALTHRLPMELPYRGEMESAFGQDFSGVEVSSTTRDALGGAGGMAQGESVAFAGTPSKHVVAHELAHVVQHRQGLTGGEALADTGVSALDRAAANMARTMAGFYNTRAKLPRPLVIEVLGDRFNISYEANDRSELVFRVQYTGPYQVGGDKVQDRAIKIATPRAEGKERTDLDVSVVSVNENGAVLDLSGQGTELAELSFDSRPHESDGNARSHFLRTRTGNKAGDSGHGIFRIDILLPSPERPAPAGIDASVLDREKTATAAISLGPDALTLVARRFGESKKVHVHVEGGEKQVGTGSLLVPIASEEGPVSLAILEQGVGFIAVDLDGDGQMDARLAHTAGVGDVEPDGTQDHTHHLDAYDRNKVKVARSFFRVRGKAWEVPAAIDNLKNPPPESAMPPASQGPLQGNQPTEGSRPVRLDSDTDWELRLDGDGDRQKELLLRFHQPDHGKPVTITAIQVSSGDSSSFKVNADDTQSPAFLDPVVMQATDGVRQTQVGLFTSLGYHTHVFIDAPVEDAAGRSYAFSAYGLADEVTHSAHFKKETLTGNALASGVADNKPVAGIRSATVRMGELGDPFLLTLEDAPGGQVFGIAGLNPDGTPGSTSGHALQKIAVKNLKVVGVTSTQVGIDLTGDDQADIVIRDAIGQQIGVLNNPSLLVARYHQMSLSGAALTGGASGARFELRGRTFQGTIGSSDADRAGAGAAGAVVGINNQQQEGADIGQLLGRFRAGVSAQIIKAGERGFISQEMLSAWKALSEEMIQLEAFSGVPADQKDKVKAREGALRTSASAHAATLYDELAKGTVNERKSEPSPIEGEGDVWSNPYTGAALQEHKGKSDGEGYYEPSTFTEIAPGGAIRVSEFLARGDFDHAAFWWKSLQSGVERWAQTRLERELGAGDTTVKQGKYMAAMTEKLTAIEKNKNVQRVFGTFTADEMYRGEKDFFQVMPLQLWAWQDGKGHWYLRDLTNPEKPFDCDADPEYHRVNAAGDRPEHFPPHHLFLQLNDKKKFPKGVIRYQIPGSAQNGTVVCEAKKKWYEYVQDVGLALAAIGLTMVTLGAGTVVALAGSYVLAGSAIAGAVAAGGELADAYEHGWLDGMTVLVNLLQIAGGVASAGSIVAGNLVRGAQAATRAVEAGTEGAALWSGRLAKLAAMADKVYIPLTATALGSDVATVVVMGADLKNKLAEIDGAGLPEAEAREAKVKLLAMFALTGGLTVLSIKGDLPEIKGGRGPTIVLDQVNGVPVAYAGGVRAGKVEIDVSPRLGTDGKPVVDANMHASARWQTRETPVKGLNEEELEWYRAWMEQPEKVTFKASGEPQIKMPDLGRPPPAGLEDKLKGMVKTTDIALYDKAWARGGDLDAVREANGGHLDIDPSSPAWPVERPKIKEKLAHSLGSERRAEEALSRYEAIRTGAHGPGHELHAAQAAKLGQLLPPGEIDQLRRMFPECEVYVTGGAVSTGATSAEGLKQVEVVVVVPKGTSPDLMAAMELRASGTRLRPDPDYVKAHPGMGTNDTLAVNAKAVTQDQLFGLGAARVKGKAPIDLHRIDVPTGPGGRPYTAAELDAMNKAGYEYDPATGQFAPRSAQTRSGLVGTAFGPLRGPNTIVGGALPSEALGQEMLRKLAGGDPEVLRVVGVEPPVDFDPRGNEWGLGRRQSDQAWVLVRGAPGEIDWNQIPGIKPRGHSHPINDPYTGKPRVLTGENGADWVTIDLLRSGKGGSSMMYLAPSGSDFAVAAKEGQHTVATPFVHLGGGKIAAPKPGASGPVVEFEILNARPDGLFHDTQLMVYQADVRITAGGEVLYEGPMWGWQAPTYSDVRFKRPDQVREVPKGFEVGEWAYRPGGAGGSAGRTNVASADLAARLKKIGLPDISDPDMAKVMAHVDARTEADLHHLLDLREKGQVKGLDDWYQGIKDETQADRLDNMMAELREARRLADENPGSIIDLGMDARAPMKHKQAADGSWHETLDKDRSFDIEVIDPTGGVTWSSEVKTIQAPVQDAPDLTKAVNNAGDKVESRLANKPGNQIPGKKEVRIEISLYKGEQSLGGTARIVYDGAGKATRMNGTTMLPGSSKRPNPANLFVEVEKNLNTPGANSLKYLDRVTLVDSSGILARYDKVGGVFIRVP